MITIGVLAKQAGLRTSAVRYYERKGLLRSRRLPNGYRMYNKSAVSALRFVRQAQSLGTTLREARRLLDTWRSGRRPCGLVRDLACQHLHEIDDKIRELRSLRKRLRMLLEGHDTTRGNGGICPIIERAGASNLSPMRGPSASDRSD
jgi:MerR family copper efflux transcriptional regulator